MAHNLSAILTINNQRYHIQRTKASLSPRLLKQLGRFEIDFVPVTAISWHKATFEEGDLHHCCKEYTKIDDVWNKDFLSLVLLLLPDRLKVQVQSKKVLHVDNSKVQLPVGPLVIEKGTGYIFKVSKLVLDTHYSFLSGIIPGTKPKVGFQEFPERDVVEVALPSRLYFEPTELQPLAGLRVAVKDTIALKGLVTGYGSRAWAGTYGPETYTAPCVQKLVDAGAIVVGKVKSSEFAEGVDPAQWEEGVCPYNPRGDGHQKPSSSSTGSAAAAAAYDWLDVTYGTDTGGSIRHPAGVQGLYGQRPTHGSIDLQGVQGATPLFNTVGIFARKTKTFTKVGGYLVNAAKSLKLHPEQRKFNLLYPTRAPTVDDRDPFHGNQLRWFPDSAVPFSSYTEAERQLEAVVSQIESELDCKRVPFNLDELWRRFHPIGQPADINEATGFIYGVITTASACTTGVDQFLADYAAANGGKEAPISKLVKERFAYGRACSKDRIAAALEAMDAFREWVLEWLFGTSDQDATTLLIFPQSWGRPDYREESVVTSALFKEYFSIYSFAYLCGCPDYTVPIGEIPYHSPITDKTEYLPVSISLVGRPGTDLELFGILDYLHDKGVISDVMAGSRMYADDMKKAAPPTPTPTPTSTPTASVAPHMQQGHVAAMAGMEYVMT